MNDGNTLLLGLFLGLVIGVCGTWAAVRLAVRARRLLEVEELERQLDAHAVRHALAMEAVRRGTDPVQADENARQILDRLRAAKLPPPTAGVFPLVRMHTVYPAAVVSGGRPRREGGVG